MPSLALIHVFVLSQVFAQQLPSNCYIVGETEHGEPIVHCIQDDLPLVAEICDPRIAGDCEPNKVPDPRPYAQPQLPLRGQGSSSLGGDTPFKAAGDTPFNAAGPPPSNTIQGLGGTTSKGNTP